MPQQGQVFKLRGGDGRDVWAFRYRLGGRGSRRVQRGGFASERDASEHSSGHWNECAVSEAAVAR